MAADQRHAEAQKNLLSFCYGWGVSKDEKEAALWYSKASDEARYVGCYASEVSFLDRVYNGGTNGANYNLALDHAKNSNKK